MLTCSVVAIAIGALFIFGVQPNSSIGADAYASEENDEPKFVTCQSAIKLSHKQSKMKYVLSSNTDQNYGSGSGQQVVTFSPQKTDHKTLWLVRESHDSTPCEAGTPIQCGSTIRLTHNDSNRNLHSHQVRASLTSQYEVSGFGSDGEGDHGDNWRVHCMDHRGKWQQKKTIRLEHVETRRYLHGLPQAEFNERNCGRNCPIMNHLEAFGARDPSKEPYTDLTVMSGILLSK